jgi:hypothetical protein
MGRPLAGNPAMATKKLNHAAALRAMLWVRATSKR